MMAWSKISQRWAKARLVTMEICFTPYESDRGQRHIILAWKPVAVVYYVMEIWSIEFVIKKGLKGAYNHCLANHRRQFVTYVKAD